jgi:flagellar basal-body rod protein FlgF
MTGSIYMAASGALTYQKRLEIISNNLANINTVGFKKTTNRFLAFGLPELQKEDNATASPSDRSQASVFWNQLITQTDFSNGVLKESGNNFDLAITGNGFFCVQTPEGIRYTRRGDFTVSPEGLLVTQQGWPVLSEGGEIMVDSQADFNDPLAHKFSVDTDGNVSVDGQQVAKLRIVDFAEPNRLEKMDATLFKPEASDVVETSAEGFQISQGYVELSNVAAVEMMTELIEVIRGYESYQKVIRSIDDINSKVINEVGKTL